jgi:hypothetical protein
MRQLKATSPIEQAARIKAAAAAGLRRRRPARAAVPRHQVLRRGQEVPTKNVEWIEYPEEGHGWALPKNRIDFWGRVEKFLDKNIGKP